ncbi:MAG: glycosyltransferase family 4 protein [Pseudonocardiaceae bacterium]
MTVTVAHRVLVLTTGYQPTIGGAETYARTVAHGLAACGHDVRVVTDHVAGTPDRTVEGPVEVIRLRRYRELLDDESKLAWEQLYFGVLPELAEVLLDRRPDVVLANSLETTIVGRIVADQWEVPLIGAYHEQAPEVEPFGHGRLTTVYGRLAPDLILAGSRFYAARARRHLPADRVRLVYHGVDTDLFRPDLNRQQTRARHGVGADQLLILNSGRLKERKGQLELIRAFAMVDDPRAQLLIVGSVSSASLGYAELLESEIDRLGLRDRAAIARDVAYSSMPTVLAAADIVAQPSLAEGLGLAVLEAMSAGRPVVATRIGGFDELRMTTDNAVLIDPSDVPGLARALARLVADGDGRAALGRAGRHHVVENFSLKAMIEQTDLAVRGVIARCSR